MRVIQITPYFGDNDGVSNCIEYLDSFLKTKGISTYVISKSNCRKHTMCNVTAKTIIENIDVMTTDIILYHFSGSNEYMRGIELLKCKKVVIYHNVSYPNLYRDVDWNVYMSLATGVQEKNNLCRYFEKAIVLSEYSKNDLEKAGWASNDVEVIPLISSEHIETNLDKNVLNKYSTKKVTMLFVGRVAPNKKIEDIISIYRAYCDDFNNNSRLIIVGNIQFENYYKALLQYISDNDIKDVIFTGGVSDEELEAYYSLADIFICMSEHEGFCLPIIEAFKKRIPVVAYKATAVPDTMGGAGILVDNKNVNEVSSLINRIMTDSLYRNDIICKEYARANDFSIEAYSEKIIKFLVDIDKYDYSSVKRKTTLLDMRILRGKNIPGEAKSILLKPYVIYGFGNAGKVFVELLDEEEKKNLIAIFDQNSNGGEKNKENILGTDLIGDYMKDNNIIITVQNGFLDIAHNLVQKGANINQIWLYDLKRNTLRK